MPMNEEDKRKIEKAVKMILEAIGEDPERQGLSKTPERVARMYGELFEGLSSDPSNHLGVVFEEEKYDEMVVLRDIPFCSMCEHHLLPFMGKAHVACQSRLRLRKAPAASGTTYGSDRRHSHGSARRQGYRCGD